MKIFCVNANYTSAALNNGATVAGVWSAVSAVSSQYVDGNRGVVFRRGI